MKIAKQKDVRVFHYIDPDDLRAIPYDIALIDRGLLKKCIWENFAAWQKDLYENEQQDDAVYIILDKENLLISDIPLKIKQLHVDFNGDYKTIFEYLDSPFVWN